MFKKLWFWLVVLIVAILLVIGVFYYLGADVVDEIEEETEILSPLDIDVDSYSHIQELHWGHMPLSYGFPAPGEFQVECDSAQRQRLRQAFDILDDETNGAVNFVEAAKDYNIFIYCNGAKARDFNIMEIVDIDYDIKDVLIKRVTFDFYEHANCGTWPDIEVIVTLLALGIPHNEDKESIMYPFVTKCDFEVVDQDIIDKLIRLYA